MSNKSEKDSGGSTRGPADVDASEHRSAMIDALAIYRRLRGQEGLFEVMGTVMLLEADGAEAPSLGFGMDISDGRRVAVMFRILDQDQEGGEDPVAPIQH